MQYKISIFLKFYSAKHAFYKEWTKLFLSVCQALKIWNNINVKYCKQKFKKKSALKPKQPASTTRSVPYIHIYIKILPKQFIV